MNLLPLLGGLLKISSVEIYVWIHIIFSGLYGIFGALQMAIVIGEKQRRLHRKFGIVITLFGLISATTGIYMTVIMLFNGENSITLQVFRLMFGSLMFTFLCAGIFEIKRGRYLNHSKWMIRAYAIGFGAVTQIFVLLFGTVLIGNLSQTQNAFLMGFGWIINIVISEILIIKGKKHYRK